MIYFLRDTSPDCSFIIIIIKFDLASRENDSFRWALEMTFVEYR